MLAPAPVAWVTRTVLVACVAIQSVSLLLGPHFELWLSFAFGIVPARFGGQVLGVPEIVPPAGTLITHMFVHGGIAHLLMNMVFFYWVGRLTEWALGSVRFVLLFLVAGICGGLLQTAIHPASVVPIVGASGAISGIFAVYLFAYARGEDEGTRFLGVSVSGDAVRAMRYAALWIGLQFLTAVAFNEGGHAGIAIWSHIGGFLAGLAYEFLIVRMRRLPN